MQWWWGLVFALGGLGLGLALGCWACGGPPEIKPDRRPTGWPEGREPFDDEDPDDTDPGPVRSTMQRYPFPR